MCAHSTHNTQMLSLLFLSYVLQQRPKIDLDARAVAGIPYAFLMACACCRKPTTEKERSFWRASEAVRKQRTKFKPQRRFVAVMVLVMYSLFPTLVASSTSIFICSDAIGGKHYLMADLTVVCYEGWHIVYLAAASTSLIVYCLGTPVVLAFMIIFDMCTCSAPTCGKKQDDDADEDVPTAGPRVKGRRACYTVFPKCICICQQRDNTPWGYRTESTRERFGLLLAGYDTDRGALVMAWEPIVVMLRKLCITLAGECERRTWHLVRS